MQRRGIGLVVAAAAVGLVLAAVVGYVLGSGRSKVTVATASFHVGAQEASGSVDGWTYGMMSSVPWFDKLRTYHGSGWPDCLAPVGSEPTVSFGWVPVTAPNGLSWREVVWVDCSGNLGS